jgi:hypothetical protein
MGSNNMKAYKELTRKALDKGLTVSVWDTEEWQVKRSSSYQAIVDAIESVDMSELRLRDQEGNIVGWALVVLDCEPECTVADYSHNPLMCELNNDTYEI